MDLSWIVGDRDSDIICGQKAGIRTILILNQEEGRQTKRSGKSTPDFKAANLLEAATIIIREN